MYVILNNALGASPASKVIETVQLFDTTHPHIVLRASSSRFAENLLCLGLPCQVQLANLQVEFV